MGSITSEIPKPMLLVRGRPILEHVSNGSHQRGCGNSLSLWAIAANSSRSAFAPGGCPSSSVFRTLSTEPAPRHAWRESSRAMQTFSSRSAIFFAMLPRTRGVRRFSSQTPERPPSWASKMWMILGVAPQCTSNEIRSGRSSRSPRGARRERGGAAPGSTRFVQSSSDISTACGHHPATNTN